MAYSSNFGNGEPWHGFLDEPVVAPDSESVLTFDGKRILVTGAGGYIGSVLARSLARLPIERLLLLDNAEQGLYVLQNELSEKASPVTYNICVGSICDDAVIREVFAEHQPHIVFHAAALKHVQLMEANPFAAVKTNTLGTQRIAHAAARCHAEQLILVSTDKAVDPISIMGASKRLAELVILSNHSSTKMKALRLCNVLGSTGSVAPLFQDQIRQGRPLTITHAETTRFFLSIERTVDCLIRLASENRSGLFIPETGVAYRIEDLARFLAAKVSADESRIVYTGLRIGDKLHEHMFSDREQLSPEVANKPFVFCKSEFFQEQQLAEAFEELSQAVLRRDLVRLMQIVKRLVPEYSASKLMETISRDAVTESL